MSWLDLYLTVSATFGFAAGLITWKETARSPFVLRVFVFVFTAVIYFFAWPLFLGGAAWVKWR